MSAIVLRDIVLLLVAGGVGAPTCSYPEVDILTSKLRIGWAGEQKVSEIQPIPLKFPEILLNKLNNLE